MDTPCPLRFKPADLLAAFARGADGDLTRIDPSPPIGGGPLRYTATTLLFGILNRSVFGPTSGRHRRDRAPTRQHEIAALHADRLAGMVAAAELQDRPRGGFSRPSSPRRVGLSSHFALTSAVGE